MRLIEADKVEQAIKDYWKAQVDKALTLTDGNEKRINIYLEHNHELLKAIDKLPSIQPDTTTHDSIPAKTGKNDAYKTSCDCISRRMAIDYCYQLINVEHQQGSDEMNYGQERVNQTETILHHLELMPSVQPFYNITLTDVLKYIDDMPEDVWQEFTACLECRGWELQWCGGDFA